MGNKTSPGPISTHAAVKVRSAVTTADSATINDTNYDPTKAMTCRVWRSVMIFPRFTGGTNPTVSLQVLYRMTSVSGNGWVLGPQILSVTEGSGQVIPVYGRDTFIAVTALTGSPTSVDLWVGGWEAVGQGAGSAYGK